jgi:hypothetical protein
MAISGRNQTSSETVQGLTPHCPDRREKLEINLVKYGGDQCLRMG